MSEAIITGSEVESYLYGLLPNSGVVLAEMEEQARKRDIPIVGPAVGRLLYLLAQMSGARRVFELGSAIGYSTLWWAEAVGEGGEVFYTDTSAANVREAVGYFERAGCEQRIRVLEGEALAMLEETPGNFDIIFCDLNKAQYPEALRRAVPRLKRGGLLVADNVLWSGQVAQPEATDADTEAVRAFDQGIYGDARLFPVILPLRDGVAVCRKL